MISRTLDLVYDVSLYNIDHDDDDDNDHNNNEIIYNIKQRS